MSADWKDIDKPVGPTVNAAQVATGPVIPPQQRLLTYSPSDWEGFVEEWAYYCLKNYKHVQRFSGAGDMGIDIAGFVDDQRLKGVWDNYQCKHYDHALTPVDVWAELGKIIWYSSKGEYTVPRSYYFVAPWGAGTKLSRLFAKPSELRKELIDNWDKHVKTEITSTQEVPLDAALRPYVDKFDFSIFDAKTALQLVDDHRSSPVHVARFGGGLRAELRGEMAALGAELRTEIAKQGGELRAEISGVARQMFVVLLGQTAVLLGFFYFFLVQLRA